MKKTLYQLIAAGLLVIGAGFSTNSMNSVENAQQEGQRHMVADQRIVSDASLNNKISVVGVNSAMTPGGMLKVQVELLNKTKSLQTFNYCFEWFDTNGMQITYLSMAVIPTVIEGGESKFIQTVAPTPACKDFRLKLIEY